MSEKVAHQSLSSVWSSSEKRHEHWACSEQGDTQAPVSQTSTKYNEEDNSTSVTQDGTTETTLEWKRLQEDRDALLQELKDSEKQWHNIEVIVERNRLFEGALSNYSSLLQLRRDEFEESREADHIALKKLEQQLAQRQEAVKELKVMIAEARRQAGRGGCQCQCLVC
eukprot:GGOE01044360.1.p1 GENE.GGOE01044360.1~~GGOE01044360.1.p1  ORF type:complete len:168 (-),score=13.23 GGOE01044360.1:468-971(-)